MKFALFPLIKFHKELCSTFEREDCLDWVGFCLALFGDLILLPINLFKNLKG